MVRLRRREPRDPDQVLARRMQPGSGRHDLEEGFSPWFPASRFDETTEAEIAMPITCQGLGNKRRRGARGTRSRRWERSRVRKQERYEYGYERPRRKSGWRHFGQGVQ